MWTLERSNGNTRTNARPNVTGVGVGERGGARVRKVFVVRKIPLSASERVPEELGSFPCNVEEIGIVSAQSANTTS